MDKAGENYWEGVWEQQDSINKVDINYYTSSLLHELYLNFFIEDRNLTICEIGGAMSQNLLYFYDYFKYKIYAIDYEQTSVIKTQKIYQNMGYEAIIECRDFFDSSNYQQFDILTSFGVFEHFENLEESIKQTRKYLKNKGLILTIIPNMNGIVGFLQKIFNKKVYNIHIPYTREDILSSHEINGYKTLFCNYYGIYQAGVINLNSISYNKYIQKMLAIPGKPLYYLHKFLNIKLDSKFNSPYIIYIGRKY